MASTKTIDADELRKIYLFATFDDQQIAEIRKSARLLHLDDGERLFDFSQPAEHFFYVRSGQIKLFRTSASGGEKVISVVRSGHTFAEAVMFMEQGRGYPVSAESIATSELLAFNQATMLDLLRGSTDSCFRLMANMSQRLRSMVDEIDELTLHNATFRLVSYLLQQVPEDVAKSPNVQLTTPKIVIASRLSIQPETFSRILARLSKRGLVETQGSHIVLRDLDGLRGLITF